MKKLFIVSLFITMPYLTHGATQTYIPSTSTYHNYTINIESGTIRQFNASTGTISGLIITQSTMTSVTISTLTVTKLTATNTVITNSSITALTPTRIFAADGSQTDPSYTFGSEAGSGFWRNGSAVIGMSISRLNRLNLTTDSLSVDNAVAASGATFQIRGSSGSAGAPSFSQNTGGGTNSGMYFPMTNGIGFSISGSEQMRITSSSTTVNGNLFVIGGGTFTLPLSMNSKKIVNLSSGSAATDAAAYGQLVYLSTATQGTITASSQTVGLSYVPSGLKAGIIPTSASSRIKITVMTTLQSSLGTVGFAYATIARNGSNLASGTGAMCFSASNVAASVEVPCSMTYIDSPATTSPLSYEVYFKTDNASSTVKVCGNAGVCTIIVEEIR